VAARRANTVGPIPAGPGQTAIFTIVDGSRTGHPVPGMTFVNL